MKHDTTEQFEIKVKIVRTYSVVCNQCYTVNISDELFLKETEQ